MKRTALLFAAFFIPIIPAFARPNPPTNFNTYDGVAPGARPLAMGGAFCAIGEDPATIYYNPAGLTTVNKQFLSMSYEVTRQSELTTDEIFSSEMLKNRNIMFIGLTSASGAVSWRPLSDTVIRTESGADTMNTEIKINAYTLSASHSFNEKFDMGLNVSYLSGSIAQSEIRNAVPSVNLASGYGCSMDIGALYRVADEFRIGLTLQNLAGFMWWDDFQQEQLPFVLRSGFAFQIPGFLTFASDLEKRFYRTNDDASKQIGHVGIEQNLGRALQVRAGISGPDFNDEETTRVSAGLGYQRNRYALSLTGEKYRVNLTDVYRYLFSVDLPL